MATLPLESLRPLGFRFRPTDEELVNHYLKSKINGKTHLVEVIREVDVCKFEPSELPKLSAIRTEDPEWFFFASRDRKYPDRHRLNRATKAGFWKTTGKDRTIKSRTVAGMKVIGMKKTLVFHRGRAPKGERTSWIMHEYRLINSASDSYVLCRLFKKPDQRGPDRNSEEVEDSSLSPALTGSSPSQKHLAEDTGEESAAPTDSMHLEEADSGLKFPSNGESEAPHLGQLVEQSTTDMDPLTGLDKLDRSQSESFDPALIQRMDSPGYFNDFLCPSPSQFSDANQNMETTQLWEFSREESLSVNEGVQAGKVTNERENPDREVSEWLASSSISSIDDLELERVFDSAFNSSLEEPVNSDTLSYPSMGLQARDDTEPSPPLRTQPDIVYILQAATNVDMGSLPRGHLLLRPDEHFPVNGINSDEPRMEVYASVPSSGYLGKLRRVLPMMVSAVVVVAVAASVSRYLMR